MFNTTASTNANSTILQAFDPALDLKIERLVDLPVEKIWDAWTKPEHVVHWFTPAPWKTLDCQIDLLEREGSSTRYTALGLHSSAEDREKHASMGFIDGWGKALEQLIEYMKAR